MTAFFVKAVFAPVAWLAGLLFTGIIVPIYQLYARLVRGLSSSTEASRGLNDVLAGRYTLPALLLIVAGCLVYYNVTQKPSAVSPDDLIGKIPLARLVSDNTGDFDQSIEEFPNLDIARWIRPHQRPSALLEAPISLYTKESPTDNEEGPATPGKPTIARTSPIDYTVQSGDTLSGIARRFGVSVNTIIWENDLSGNALIKPGDTLTILPASGVAHTVTSGQTLGQIANLYGVDTQKIMAANGLSNPNQLRIGAKLVIPGGNKIIAQAPKTTTAKINQSLNAIKKLIKPGPSIVVPSGTRMVWPTSGHNITQYYSWRHTGVDIANRIGTPIYAADDGTVTAASWNNGGYGNQIIITHAGGKQTRYAHLSAYGVNVGQKVKKGQYIAAMGSTGRSTGPHLHFEVMISGQRYNPLNYVR